MSEFKVNTSMLGKDGAAFNTISKEVYLLADRLQKCSKILQFRCSNTEKIKLDIDSQLQSVLIEASKLDLLSDALHKIVEHYESVEKRIVSQDEIVLSEESYQFDYSLKTNDKRSVIRQIWDWIWRKRIDTSYIATTSEQEDAVDRKLQEQITNLLSNVKYTQEYWCSITPDERKNILEDYMCEVAIIMGVYVNQKIDFFDEEIDENGRLTMGSYNHSFKTIRVNEYLINKLSGSGSYQLLKTIVHELRHAYQHSAIDNPTNYQVTKETIEMWKESFRTYQEYMENGYETYRNIKVEIDARRFAGQ